MWQLFQRRGSSRTALLVSRAVPSCVVKDGTIVCCAHLCNDHPWGVNDFSHDLQVKVIEDNRCAKAAVDVFTMCVHYRIPASVEHPKTPFLWRLCEFIESCKLANTVDVHQCVFGKFVEQVHKLVFVQCDWSI